MEIKSLDDSGLRYKLILTPEERDALKADPFCAECAVHKLLTQSIEGLRPHNDYFRWGTML